MTASRGLNMGEDFVELRKIKYINEIATHFKEVFNVHTVKFWTYDTKHKVLHLIGSEENNLLSLRRSLTQRAIEEKTSVISNHIVSDKHYCKEMDNPLDLEVKMKSLIIFPIFKNKEIIGLVKMWRGMNQKKDFTKNDKTLFEIYASPLLKIIEFEEISKNQFKDYEEREETYNSTIEEYQKELKVLEKRHKKLEQYSSEFSSEINVLKKENKDLKVSLKKNSMKELMSKKSSLTHEKSSKIDENVEFLLQKYYHIFAENENVYILFEFILYALSSKKNMTYLEESIKKSKLIYEIIDGYSFKNSIKVYNEKYKISDLIDNIQTYEKKIFLEKYKLKVTWEKGMPPSLILDAPKIKSIIFHLLIDIYQLAVFEDSINLHFTFKNKVLYIELDGFIYQKGTLLKAMFKKTKLDAHIKDRLGFQVSQILIKSLNGKFEATYRDKYYKFVLTLPTQIIKI